MQSLFVFQHLTNHRASEVRDPVEGWMSARRCPVDEGPGLPPNGGAKS
jgi:hypothetical protein